MASLPKRVPFVFGDQPVGLVDEQHPAQGLLADFLHALGGLRDVADDEVLLGDLHDVGTLNLAQPEQDFGDDAREAGLGGAGRALEHHVVLVGGRGLLALGGQQLVDLNLGAPHRDLLLGALQADQLVQPRLRLGKHLLLFGGQRGGVALGPAGFGARVPLVGAGGDRLGVGDDQPVVGVVHCLAGGLELVPVDGGGAERGQRGVLVAELAQAPPAGEREIGGHVGVGAADALGDVEGGLKLSEAGGGGRRQRPHRRGHGLEHVGGIRRRCDRGHRHAGRASGGSGETGTP